MRYQVDAMTWWVTWLGVFALNLIVPLGFGWSMVEERGRVGMGLTLLSFLLLSSYVAGVKSRFFHFALPVGGAFVALSQVCPILQVGAGMAGMTAAHLLGQTAVRGISVSSEFGGFIITLVTGSILQAVAVGVGGVAYLIWYAIQSSQVQH